MAVQRSRHIPWRLIGWGGAAMLLAMPFVAMQMQAPGVDWSLGDFIFMGALFAVIGGLLELAFRVSPDTSYRTGFGLALLGTFLVIWVNLAVGIVGSEDNRANLWFFAALLVGIAGVFVSRLRAPGMALATVLTAIALMLAFAVAAMGPTDEPFVPRGRELIGTCVLAGLFAAAAALFRRAAQSSSSS